MDFKTIELFELSKKYYFSENGFIAPEFLITFTLATLKIEIPWIIIFICGFYIIWFLQINYTNINENKINLLIAIEPETIHENNILRNDLIREIKNNYTKLNEDINIIELNSFLTKKYQNYNNRKLVLDKNFPTKIIFLFGIIKKRQDNNYYIDTTLHWNHNFIHNKNTKERYQKEISKYWPKYKLSEKEQVQSFKITSEIMVISIELLIITILELSQEFEKSLLRSKQLLLKKNLFNNLIKNDNVYNHIFFSIQQIINKKYDPFSNNEKNLPFIKNLLSQNKDFIKNHTSPNIYKECLCNIKAIITFLETKDVKKARPYLKKIAKATDLKTISSAFLFAYSNKTNSCEIELKKLKNIEYDPVAILETEIFTLETLKTDPNNYSLYFYLGYLNKFFKKDQELAKKYFENYLKNSDDVKIKEKVKKWIN